MMESGPVGGIIAAAEVAGQLGFPNVIAFDMGGTTAKASLIHERTPTVADGYYVGGYSEGYPVLSPVVDVVEVGTGGGSIAWIDEVGALKVGPRSAGADPGPICYGHGGTQPTITDANVALGRIRPGAFLGGEMSLDLNGALAGIGEHVAVPLEIDTLAAAHGSSRSRTPRCRWRFVRSLSHRASIRATSCCLPSAARVLCTPLRSRRELHIPQ